MTTIPINVHIPGVSLMLIAAGSALIAVGITKLFGDTTVSLPPEFLKAGS